METLLSIRMRASKKKAVQGRTEEIHISGAEGLYPERGMNGVVKGYLERAFTHPKGRPDRVTVTVEPLLQPPLMISTLPVVTAGTRTVTGAHATASSLLMSLDLSEKALRRAWGLTGKATMRGAAILHAKTGRRLDREMQRGVRVSRLGISPSAARTLSVRLSKYGINNDTVKEALILASKVAAYREIVAELCISDDPCYTTGYVASRAHGYVRIPHMKKRRSGQGGRVFFVMGDINMKKILEYLEKTPVMVGYIAPCSGVRAPNEIIHHHK